MRAADRRFRLSPERISTPNGADRELPNATSPLTTVPRVMVSEPRLSRLFAFIQRRLFPVGQMPQPGQVARSEEHTSELQSHLNLVCRLLLEKKKKKIARC